MVYFATAALRTWVRKKPPFVRLDDLLVDGLGRVVHDDCAGLVVDLCVYARVADEVDNPLLALVLRQAKPGREIPGFQS